MELENTNVLGDFNLSNESSSTLDTKRKLTDVFNGFAAMNTGTMKVNGVDITFDVQGTVGELIDKVNKSDAGVKMSYDTFYNTLVFSSATTGAASTMELDDNAQKLMSSMGLRQTEAAADAEIRLNDGKVVTRASNTFDLYGITVQLNSKTTEGNPVMITTEKDAKGSMELITKFVESYNKLVEDLRAEYSATKPKKGVNEPLTAEEKKNMTETQIKTWEDAAKKGSLNRDPLINDLTNQMRKMMYESVELPSGGKISLFEIGITTSANYRDGGKLIINEDKLKKALTERTDDVVQLFTKNSTYLATDKANATNRLKDEGLSERLNDLLNAAVSSNGTIGKKAGFGTADTGSDMYKELKVMDTKISDMYKMLIQKEESYYAKFAAMEKAITASNSQMSALESFMAQ